MTFRDWIAIPGKVWRGHRRQHRAYIDGCGWIYEGAPFCQRLWHRHLFWLPRFAKAVFAVYWLLIRRNCEAAYCITGDRLLGGDRYARFLQTRETEIAALNAQAARNQKKITRAAEVVFAQRLQREAERNPGVIPPDRNTIQ